MLSREVIGILVVVVSPSLEVVGIYAVVTFSWGVVWVPAVFVILSWEVIEILFVVKISLKVAGIIVVVIMLSWEVRGKSVVWVMLS